MPPSASTIAVNGQLLTLGSPGTRVLINSSTLPEASYRLIAKSSRCGARNVPLGCLRAMRVCMWWFCF